MLIALMLLGWSMLCAPANADGKFYPPRTYPTTPSIPSQTALIAFEDGIETLIVESTMEAEAGEQFAWVLPLPAAPTDIDKATPGTLETLRFCIGPRLINALQIEVGWVALVFALSSSFFIGFGILRKTRFLYILAILAIVTLLYLISVPNFLEAGSTPSSHLMLAETLRREQVGNYDVAVLRGRSHEELANWLDQNQFTTLDEDSKAIVDQYITEDWVFLVAKLTRADTGALTPHPLKVVFPVKEPVYPMRLTALAETNTLVTLFVVGDQRYKTSNLKCQFADGMREIIRKPFGSDIPHFIKSKTFDRAILTAHPALFDLIPDGRWITRLEGRLSPRQMKNDLILRGRGTHSRPYRKTLYTPGGAIVRSVRWPLWLLVPIFPLVCLLGDNRIPARKILLSLLRFFLIIVLAIYLFTSVAHDVHIGKPRSDDYNMRRLSENLQKEGGFPYWMEILHFTPPADIAILDQPNSIAFQNHVEQIIVHGRTNPFSGQPARLIDSPGNCLWRIDENGQRVLDYYDYLGVPHALPLDALARNWKYLDEEGIYVLPAKDKI